MLQVEKKIESRALSPEGFSASARLVLHARVVTGQGGGPDKTILTAPRYYQEHGFAGKCLYFRPPADSGFAMIRSRAEQQQTKIIECNDRGPLDINVVMQAWRLCRRLRPSIWHGHDYKTNLLGLLLARTGCKMHLVTTVHGWVRHTRRTPLYYKLDRLCLPSYQQIYCVSPDQVEICQQLGVRQDQVFLLDNGVDVENSRRTSSAKSSRRRWFPFVGDGILLGAMGRLSGEKGFDRLIRIVAEQISAGKNWFLVIAGDGDERSRLQALIEELGMGGRIRLLGFCEQVRGFFESLDLFVLSSLREGLPNVVLEAMAYEVPVLSTRVAGVPRLIEHAEHGWLVGIDDRQGLADGLVKLADDPSLRQRLASAGRERVEQSFNFRERARKQCQLYQQLFYH